MGKTTFPEPKFLQKHEINSQGKTFCLRRPFSTNTHTSARQTRDTTTETQIAYSNSTWHASKYKAHKLHQRMYLGWTLCT
ncbi:hypothetical protein, partial [Thiolapillus sp.]|uniref:hypothetical protein n=1 Tax=Thiolapillus sp. TaxID=2017437 RepID=UPI003AF891CC